MARTKDKRDLLINWITSDDVAGRLDAILNMTSAEIDGLIRQEATRRRVESEAKLARHDSEQRQRILDEIDVLTGLER